MHQYIPLSIMHTVPGTAILSLSYYKLKDFLYIVTCNV